MIYIIKENNFLADYILDALKQWDDIVQIRFARTECHGVKRYIQLVVRFFRAILFNKKGLCNSWFFPDDFMHQLKAIGNNDKVLLFSCQNLKELLVLDKEISCPSKSVFLWNPLSTINENFYSRWEYAHYLHRTKMRVCTFDDGDARAYGFELVNQVYRLPDAELQSERTRVSSDIFFICKDKRRSKAISDVLKEFDRQGITHDFYILRDKHTKPRKELLPYYTDKLISYKDYCIKAMHSKCLLEILQKGQTGMTMRTLEALFFKKKLITTNPGIRTSRLYHPNNIYVLDGSESRTIRDFIDSDFHEYPDQIINQYDIRHWVKQFM